MNRRGWWIPVMVVAINVFAIRPVSVDWCGNLPGGLYNRAYKADS